MAAALRVSPCGEIISYGELARCIGDPKAVRAMASPMGRTRLELLRRATAQLNLMAALAALAAGWSERLGCSAMRVASLFKGGGLSPV